MGVAIKEIIKTKEIELNELCNKTLAIDAHNILYQFLTTIRARDGSLFKDTKGNITSHLIGLFTRTTRLLQQNIKPIFIFDGKPPELKQQECERRRELKLKAELEYEEAKRKHDIEEMKKYAARASRLTKDLIKEAKRLLDALGIPIIQAPSEGEAQAAFLVKKGDAYASVSQDFDSLLYGSLFLVRNLSIVGRRKQTKKLSYEKIKPELIDLSENLNFLGIDQNQLIALAMLVGTDFNSGGIPNIGPKTALNLVKKYGTDFHELFSDVGWEKYFKVPWQEVFNLIKDMPVKEKYDLTWADINKEKVIKLLVDEHDFSYERVENQLEKLLKEKKQKGLTDFF